MTVMLCHCGKWTVTVEIVCLFTNVDGYFISRSYFSHVSDGKWMCMYSKDMIIVKTHHHGQIGVLYMYDTGKLLTLVNLLQQFSSES